ATTPTPADPESRRDPRWSSGRKLPSLARRHDPAAPPVPAHTTRAADPGILPALAGRTIPLPGDFSLRSAARLRSERQSLRYRLGSSRGVACADVRLLPPRSAPRFSETSPSTQTAAPARVSTPRWRQSCESSLENTIAWLARSLRIQPAQRTAAAPARSRLHHPWQSQLRAGPATFASASAPPPAPGTP